MTTFKLSKNAHPAVHVFKDKFSYVQSRDGKKSYEILWDLDKKLYTGARVNSDDSVLRGSATGAERISIFNEANLPDENGKYDDVIDQEEMLKYREKQAESRGYYTLMQVKEENYMYRWRNGMLNTSDEKK